eukprot:CAMPEP_0113552832 /NCGR_PEP_ID=MMETSP0015_2-20120614/15282_1 /TAXON_ID=2838 /ORGANISM="Odontella" /LENGTH=336 /DNA_ID=CAMNT_0000453845 /DNA_START=192 /DNA_END=1199 /DNA_ORIENTATION=- /assembly_acc=CAM_ASM_000160
MSAMLRARRSRTRSRTRLRSAATATASAVLAWTATATASFQMPPGGASTRQLALMRSRPRSETRRPFLLDMRSGRSEEEKGGGGAEAGGGEENENLIHSLDNLGGMPGEYLADLSADIGRGAPVGSPEKGTPSSSRKAEDAGLVNTLDTLGGMTDRVLADLAADDSEGTTMNTVRYDPRAHSAESLMSVSDKKNPHGDVAGSRKKKSPLEAFEERVARMETIAGESSDGGRDAYGGPEFSGPPPVDPGRWAEGDRGGGHQSRADAMASTPKVKYNPRAHAGWGRSLVSVSEHRSPLEAFEERVAKMNNMVGGELNANEWTDVDNPAAAAAAPPDGS